MAPQPTPPIERLLPRITKQPDGCWIWQGTTVNGYGVIQKGSRAERRVLKVHRVSYEHFVGPIPEGLDVRHLCHVRRCVNPEHLAVGSRKENMQDSVRDGRSTEWWRSPMRGERNGMAKLSNADVIAIRSDTRPLKIIAAEYGVSHTHICCVRKGRHRSFG